MRPECVLFALFCVALLADGWVNCAVVQETVCETDTDCRWYECCVTKLTGDKKICRGKGDDIGVVCGGMYFCGCKTDLICEPLSRLRDQSDCAFPANGTCQMPFRPPSADLPPMGRAQPCQPIQVTPTMGPPPFDASAQQQPLPPSDLLADQPLSPSGQVKQQSQPAGRRAAVDDGHQHEHEHFGGNLVK